MTCADGTDDAAYVLGALGPRERLDFERHLAGCPECTRAVSDLAGLPGLLGRVDPLLLGGPGPDDGAPGTLLPALSEQVRGHARRTRRRVVAVAAAAVLAAVLATAGATALLDGTDAAPGAASSPTAPQPAPDSPAARMTPVGEVPVRATVTLEAVTWGTRLGLDCTYDTGAVDYALPPAVDYLLYVRTRDGEAERLGSWRSVDGQTMRLSAGTAARRDEIESVEVRAPDGRVVLLLRT